MNKSTRQYLADVKRRLSLSSNYGLAKRLEISEQAIANLMSGGVMSATTAAKVAEILELEPLQVIADAELERAKSSRDRELWARIRAAATIAGGAIGAAVLYQVIAGGFDINGFSAALAALSVPVGNWTEIHINALWLAGVFVLSAAGALALLPRRSSRAPA